MMATNPRIFGRLKSEPKPAQLGGLKRISQLLEEHMDEMGLSEEQKDARDCEFLIDAQRLTATAAGDVHDATPPKSLRSAGCR